MSRCVDELAKRRRKNENYLNENCIEACSHVVDRHSNTTYDCPKSTQRNT